MGKVSTNSNNRILDRFIEKSKFFGPVAIGSGVILLALIFVRSELTHKPPPPYSPLITLKERFPVILMVLSYTLYITRVHWSLGALAKCKDFWEKIEPFFADREHICDNFCKIALAVMLIVSATAFTASEFGYIGQCLEWFLLAILIISVLWQFIIHHRLKILVNENKVTSGDVTTAISSWLILDFTLACFLLFFNVYSKIPAFSDYPLVQADAFFWVHIVLTIKDLVKNKAIYKLC